MGSLVKRDGIEPTASICSALQAELWSHFPRRGVEVPPRPHSKPSIRYVGRLNPNVIGGDVVEVDKLVVLQRHIGRAERSNYNPLPRQPCLLRILDIIYV